MHRHGYTEECYFNFTFTPIYGEGGKVEGVFNAVIETTKTVLNERQLQTLRDLGNLDRTSKTVDEVLTTAAKILERNNKDFPFAIIYKIFEEENKALPISYVGTNDEQFFFPTSIDLIAPTNDTENFYKAYSTNSIVVSKNKDRRKNLPKGGWDIEATHFIHLPIASQSRKTPVAILSAALNPYRQFDGLYHQFAQLVADQISTEVNNVLAYEEERRRAEALAEIDKAKTAFFTNISHEFRTPLTLMLGSLEGLLNKQTVEIGDKNKQAIETSHRNAVRMLRLVNNLLDFSRIEAGKVKAQFRLTDLCRYTRDLASTFRSVIEHGGLQFHVQCEDFIQPVYVDKEMWEKIVLNLLSNAFKYTLSGSITISLNSHNNEAILKVRDTGIGIPEEELPKMFQRFHRAQNVTGRTYEGTGIGLSLVKELVQMHGGKISVRSKLGKGTEFSVTIPIGKNHLPVDKIVEKELDFDIALSDAFVEEADSLITKKEVDTVNDVSKHAPTVLVVDDNADMRSYIKNILLKSFKVFTATNGMDALLKIKEKHFDAVVSDVMMPIMDGIQLLKTIKEMPQTAILPVILVSARAGEDAKIEGLDIGADDYLVKPFSAKELLARVRSQIDIAKKRNNALKDIYTLFDEVPFAVAALKGPQLIIEYINQYNLNIWQQSREEILGKPLFEARPDIKVTAASIHEEIYHTGKRFEAKELPIKILVNGKEELHYFNSTIDPMRDEEGKIVGQLAASIDVTEQVLARRRIEESEMQVRALNEHLASELDATKTLQEFSSMVFEDDETLYQSLLSTAVKLMKSDLASVQLYDEERQELVLKGTQNFHPHSVQFWQRVAACSGSVCGEALARKSRIIVPDIEATEFAKQELPVFRLSQIRSVQSTPLVSRNGKLIGMLNTQWKAVHHLTEEDFKYFDVLVGQASDIIEKKIAEQKIEESESRVRIAVESGELGTFDIDLTQPSIIFSDRLAVIFGLDPAKKSSHQDLKNALHPDDVPIRNKAHEEALKSGALHYEARVIWEDGSVHWVRIHGEVKYENGEAKRIYGIAQDITEEKNAQQRIRESEERYALTINATNLGIWDFDVKNKVVIGSGKMAAIYDLAFNEEYTLDIAFNSIYPDDRTEQNQFYEAITTGKVDQSFVTEYRIVPKNSGIIKWIRANGKAFFDENGQLSRTVGTVADITKSKQTENALKESEKKYRELAISLEKKVDEKTADLKRKNEELKTSEERYHKMIDEVEDYAIILLDKNGVVQNWNKGAEKIKGYKEKEIIGKNFSKFYLEEDLKARLPEKILEEARTNGKALYEGWRVRKDGSRFWGSIVLTALHDHENKIIGFSKVTRDLTRRKLAEDRMQEYTNQLEFKNKELEQFSYAASHDMKEPLRKILFYVSAVSDKLNGQIDEKSKNYLSRSISAAQRMQGLIEDLLVYARTNSNDEIFEEVDLAQIVNEIALSHKDDFEQKNVSIETANLNSIIGIPFQIKQLFENLIGNSIKYKHPDRNSIIKIKEETISGSQSAVSGLNVDKQYIHVSVSDNGIGFDPEYSEKIFEIFQRLNNAPDAKGSGIGLALCKRIVENHRGIITATGKKNVGARVDIYLPKDRN